MISHSICLRFMCNLLASCLDKNGRSSILMMYCQMEIPASFMLCRTISLGKSTTFNVVFLAQNEANYRDLMFNKMFQQIGWQANLHVCFRFEDAPVWSSY